MRTVIILMLIVGMLLIILTAPVVTSPGPSGPPLLSPDLRPIGGVLAGLALIAMLLTSQIRSKIITSPGTETKHPLNWDFTIQLASLAVAVASLVASLLALLKL